LAKRKFIFDRKIKSWKRFMKVATNKYYRRVSKAFRRQQPKRFEEGVRRFFKYLKNDKVQRLKK